MVLILSLLIALAISFIMLRYWKVSSYILRILTGLLLLTVFIASLSIVFCDMYESSESHILLKDASGKRVNISISNADIIIKRNYAYHVYSMTVPPYRGYTLYNNSIRRMQLGRELLIKTILLLPLVLLIFVIFGEQNILAGIMHIERMNLRHRDKMYIDHSVASVMKSLRENIEKLRTRRNEFERVNEQIILLEKRVQDEEMKQYLKTLKSEYETIMDNSQFKTEFSSQLSQCSNYVEEALLRLDFNDISIAINVFLRGLESDLTKMTGEENTLRELVKTAHEKHILNYDMMYNLNWLINLDHDYLKHKNDIFPDIARIRKIFNDYKENALNIDNNRDKIHEKEAK